MASDRGVDADPAGIEERAAPGSRRERILAEAATLFARDGYRSTSLNDLARESGIAKPTLFHYFASKQEILFHLYRQTLDLALARMRGVIEPDGDAVESISAWVREHAVLILENRELFTILFDEEAELSGEQREVIHEQQRAYIHLISDKMRALQAQGRMRESVSPNIAAQGLIGMASWVYRWYEPGGHLAAAEIADMLAEIGVHGVLGQAPQR